LASTVSESIEQHTSMIHSSYPTIYKERLYPWAIARLFPNMQRSIVGRFRSRSDADGHLRLIRQLIPNGQFVVIFDHQPEKSLDPKDSEVHHMLNERLNHMATAPTDITNLEQQDSH
jgi:hypothetical protein